MNWTKASAYHMDGEDGWRLCKAFVGEKVIYTLSHRGVLVRSSASLEELKQEAANENRDEA